MKSEEKTEQARRRKKPAAAPSGGKRRRPQTAKRTVTREKTAETRKRTVTRSRNRRTEERRRKTTENASAVQREPIPEVVYMPPKQFNRNRFVLHLITLVAVVLALTFVFSIFFKVKTVTVSGTVKYDAWTIREASGIKEGEGLLSFGNAKAAGRIRTLLPYVKEVQIGIKLPDTVKIEIVESSVAYSIAAADGSWWLISAEGKVLEQTTEILADSVTKIEGLTLAVPVGAYAVAHEEKGQNAFGDDIAEIDSAADKLAAMKQILQELEMNGVMGTVTTVDVTHLTDLRLWFGEKYRVDLGDNDRIPYKIDRMQAVFEQEEFLEAGIIDVSFTDEERPKTVIFKPFKE